MQNTTRRRCIYHKVVRTIHKESGPDVRVLVRSGVVTVQVERPVVLVLVVVTAHTQHHAAGVVVAVVAPKPKHENTGLLVQKPQKNQKILARLRRERLGGAGAPPLLRIHPLTPLRG